MARAKRRRDLDNEEELLVFALACFLESPYLRRKDRIGKRSGGRRAANGPGMMLA
jgi:hypothetical protein